MVHNIIMPDLGQTVAEGKVLRWLKRPGDQVTRGEALLEVETDKVTMEVESYRSGFLRAILVREGEMATAFSAVAVLTDQADEIFQVVGGGSASGVPLVESFHRPHAGDPLTGGESRSEKPSDGRIRATPAAKARARELGIDLGLLPVSRPDGLITRRDVDRAPRAATRPAHPMAAITARSLQSIPHFYVTIDADMGTALSWRKQWNADHPDSRLTLNDVFVRVASLALRDLPEMNGRFVNGMIQQRPTADVLLIVASDSGLSWIPIADPAGRGWLEHGQFMRQALKSLNLSVPLPAIATGPPALAVSNLGMFGVRNFTAIIPPDCAAVLAIGAVREEPVVRARRIEIGDRCALTLAADHRVVDGVKAAKFLGRIQIHLNSL